MKKLNICLVAHDSRKEEMCEWVKYNYKTLEQHNLYATGTTGSLIRNLSWNQEFDEYNNTIVRHIQPFKDNVTCLYSGPIGGDFQIGAMIAESKIDVLIFFCDNLIVQGHQNDVSALGRLASLYNIPYATNRTTADFIITSPLFGNDSYERIIPKAIENYKNRKLK